MNREESLAFVEENITKINTSVGVIRIAGIMFPISGLVAVGLAKLTLNMDDKMIMMVGPLAAFGGLVIGLGEAISHREREFLNNLKKELNENEVSFIILNKEDIYTITSMQKSGQAPVEIKREINTDLLKSYTKAKRRHHRNGREAIKDLNIISY